MSGESGRDRQSFDLVDQPDDRLPAAPADPAALVAVLAWARAVVEAALELQGV